MRRRFHLLRSVGAAGLLLLPAAAAHAQTTDGVFIALLSGANEVPGNASPGTGTAIVTFDHILSTIRVQISFADLVGTTTASHIHCCLATGNQPVATQTPTFPLFPLGVTSGTYDQTFDLTLASSYNTAFITANGGTVASAFAALTTALFANQTYLNIHTSSFPGGEIRGTLVLTPEPGSFALMVPGLLALGLMAGLRKTRRHRASRQVEGVS